LVVWSSRRLASSQGSSAHTNISQRIKIPSPLPPAEWRAISSRAPSITPLMHDGITDLAAFIVGTIVIVLPSGRTCCTT